MVSAQFYQPERGDFIYLDFTPQAGTEQAGRRPALVLSPQSFNIAIKGSGFEVAVTRGSGLSGVVLSDHLRSVDWIERKASFHSKAPAELLIEVLARLEAILGLYND